MPIYEFECGKCGSRFEELMESGSVVPACPRCGSTQAQRLLSPVSPPARLPRGAKARASESRRREREAARSERLAEVKKSRGSS